MFRSVPKRTLMIRFLMSVSGVCLTGFGVALMKYAAFGIDPFQVLMAGLHAVLPCPFGLLFAAVCGVFTLFALTQDHRMIGVATVITLFLQGYVIDASLFLLNGLFPSHALYVRIPVFVLGFFVLCVSTAVYFTADLGVSPYDSLSLIVTNVWHKERFSVNRIISDAVCVLTGAVLCWFSGGVSLLFGSVGTGTVLTVCCMGPLVSFFSRRWIRPWYDRLTRVPAVR